MAVQSSLGAFVLAGLCHLATRATNNFELTEKMQYHHSMKCLFIMLNLP